MPPGGRTWDPNTGTWWSETPYTRAPRRHKQSGGNSGCAVLFVIVLGFLVLGSVVSSGSQSTSNAYPYDTPYVVFGDFNAEVAGKPIAMATAAAQDLPSATFPARDPLVASGGLSQARADHTATLLRDGRVVVAGGRSAPNSPSAVALIETYDPKTRSFAPTGLLLTARSGHTATLLKDGTVLFAGGTGSDGEALASAEIYNPKTGKSYPTGGMAVARVSGTAMALDDGTVLMVGGTDGNPVWSTEIYDPSSGVFKELDHVLVNQGITTAVKLKDGRVLVAGGDISGPWSNAIEIYGPTGSIDIAAGIEPRDDATSCLLADGRAMIVGGLGNSEQINTTAELLDPQGLPAISLISLGAPRWHNTTTALPDGSALIVGGSNDAGDPIATVERYYPGSPITTPVGTMAETRSEHTATLLADGSVLIAGGWSSSATALSDAGLYFPNGAPTSSPSDSLTPTGGSPVAPAETVKP